MVDIAHASERELHDLLHAFAGVEWPLSRPQLMAIADGLRWQADSERRRGVTFRTGLTLADSFAECLLRDDRVERVKVDLTEVVEDDDASWAESLLRAERALVEMATAMLGDPSSTVRRRRRTVWDLATGGRLAIANIRDLVILDVLGPTFADTERAEARLGVDAGRITGVDPERG